MKILMLGWELPPHNSGGLGVACYNLCKALTKSDIDIEFIVPYSDQHEVDFMAVTPALNHSAKALQAGASAYHSYKYSNEELYAAYQDIFSQQRVYENNILKVVAEKEFDIVHAHDWLTFRAALRLKEEYGWPVVMHVHSVESDRAGGNHGNPLVHEIEDVALHLADQIVAVSGYTKDLIVRDYGVPASKIQVVHNSLDLDELSPLDDQNVYHYLTAVRSRGYRVVVSVGRLTIQKGLTNLLRAFKEVVGREPKTFLLIVGSGDQYYELIEEAASLGIARQVFFAGFQRGKPWRDAFAVGDLFVLPSVSEPFGLTPLEAIGYGTPALVSRQSGVSEVLRSCLKVDFWDISEMANQITAVIRSPALRQSLQQNALAEVASQSWAQAADKMLAIYEDTLKEKVPV
ncbi:MAG TPA: glycosyltransferase family 4 protein [Candidatus Saccharimonadales bacterium]|nr:glycosyltransferase family 4 protein [Candidatus Saccharimonadales bacterium]